MFEKNKIITGREAPNGSLPQQRAFAFATCVFTALFLLGASFAGESVAGEVWVANMKGANVQVIDTDSNLIMNTIPTGAGAHNVTFSPDGKLAYIANLGTGSITIIDAVTKAKLADVPTDIKAHDVAVSPDGKMIVSCNMGAGNITFIHVGTMKAVHTMATGKRAITAVYSQDGQKVYVVNAEDANITVIDANTHEILQTLPGAKDAMAIRPAGDWGQLWLTAPTENKLLLMNPKTGLVEAFVDVPGEPHGLVFSPNGKTVYVGQRGLNQISMVDTTSRKIVKTMALGKRPDMIAISADGKTVFVAIRDENKLAVLSAADLHVIAQVATDGETHGVAYRE